MSLSKMLAAVPAVFMRENVCLFFLHLLIEGSNEQKNFRAC